MDSDSEQKLISLMTGIVSVASSMALGSQAKPESELILLVSQAISVFNTMDLDSDSLPEQFSKVIDFFSHNNSPVNSIYLDSYSVSNCMSLIHETRSLEPQHELILLIKEILGHLLYQQPTSAESRLIKRITKLESINLIALWESDISRCFEIISGVNSMDLASRPKPDSELMSLVTQTVYVISSMDVDSLPEPLPELVSLIAQNIPLCDDTDLEPKLVSLINEIISLVISKSSRWKNFISLSSQVQLRFEKGKVYEQVPLKSNNKWDCLPGNWRSFSLREHTPFFCYGCNGQNHEEYEQAPVEIKHSLHPKHSLHLVLLEMVGDHDGKRCFCCGRYLEGFIYYCSACDFVITFSCVEKPPVLFIDHPKWHEHKLALFSRTTSLTCDVCALVDSTCPLYICPPCGFVAHQRCLSLPRVIRISRHLHRISFTHSFHRGDWVCGVCRRKVDNDYGGYTCIKNGCSYAAHSKCATQSNVWDGIELEGVPEEAEEEELEPPFVRISDGIIQHFSHEHHHLKLDENTGRDYDENQLCQACVTPVHYGNFYYCLQCDNFILHEKCANLSRTIYNPIHPHLLTLVTNDSDVNEKIRCSACPWWCAGFFYKCGKDGCDFRVHVLCGTISEPLDHESHRHPLFLTSKPGEKRKCGVCNDSRRSSRDPRRDSTDETFNCIECDFALCFACATLPEKVRYKHDKHMLTLSYGEETSTMTYWCEACEKKINPKKRFYKCDEYCGVTLHIECLVECGLYMKPGVWWTYNGNRHITVKANNHRMSLPFCQGCGNGNRCQQKFSFISCYFKTEPMGC